MPSAISRPSEPVETVAMSIDLSFLPSRMIEPLPKLRSICDSAASRAFDLSMDGPSTRRSAALIVVCSLWPGFGRYGSRSTPGLGPLAHSPLAIGDKETVHDLFYVRNMFFFG